MDQAQLADNKVLSLGGFKGQKGGLAPNETLLQPGVAVGIDAHARQFDGQQAFAASEDREKRPVLDHQQGVLLLLLDPGDLARVHDALVDQALRDVRGLLKLAHQVGRLPFGIGHGQHDGRGAIDGQLTAARIPLQEVT